MSTSKKVAVSGSSRFSGALHAQMHQSFMNHVDLSEIGLAKLNIAQTLMDSYRANIKAEVEINRQAAASEVTQQLIDLDRRRAALLYYFFGAHRNALRSPVAAEKSAADTLNFLLAPYAGIEQEAYDVETLHITGLITDLGKPENLALIKVLRLDAVLGQIEARNLEYIELAGRNVDTRAAQTAANAKTARPRTDADHAAMADTLNASYLLSAVPEEKAQIGALIDQLNVIIADFKTTHKQMEAQRKAKPTPKTADRE